MEEEIKEALKQNLRIEVERTSLPMCFHDDDYNDIAITVRLYWRDELITKDYDCI